jgi:hypothetical protein
MRSGCDGEDRMCCPSLKTDTSEKRERRIVRTSSRLSSSRVVDQRFFKPENPLLCESVYFGGHTFGVR